MNRRPVPVTPFALLLAACGGAPGAPAPPPALAVMVPEDTAVVYVQGDTSEVNVDAAGQTFTVNAESRSTLGVGFADAAGGVRVSVRFQDFEARLDNPMGTPQTATEDQVTGELVYTLDRRGRATIVVRPELEGTAAEFLSPDEVAATLIPRLPGRAVTPGDVWTDTVRVDAETRSATVESRAIMTYTTVGDSVVDGRSYLLVRFTGDISQSTVGAQGDFQVTQEVEGTTQGHFLWDLGRGLLHSTGARSELRGTMDVTGAPVPLSIRIRSRSRTRLQEM